MQRLANRSKLHAALNDLVDGGIVAQIGTHRHMKRDDGVAPSDKDTISHPVPKVPLFENVAYAQGRFAAQVVRDGTEHVVHVIVKARRGLRKVVVQDYELVSPAKR